MADFFGKLKSGAGKVAFEADKMAKVNRAQSELAKLKQQVDGLHSKLGEVAYQQFVNPGAETPDIAGMCQNITEMHRQMGLKNEEIQRINADTYSPQGVAAASSAPPVPVQNPPELVNPTPIQAPTSSEVSPAAPTAQTKFCPNCGKEMALAVKFCPDCGTKTA
jgi:hypothetical protein